jgi:maltooligosyltrehalose synthase
VQRDLSDLSAFLSGQRWERGRGPTGIRLRLPYLAELGVDAIWLSPIFPSPMADFGYDIADYTDVDPLFGRLTDRDELIASSHAVGIKVILALFPTILRIGTLAWWKAAAR